jgi:hypothetical protein
MAWAAEHVNPKVRAAELRIVPVEPRGFEPLTSALQRRFESLVDTAARYLNCGKTSLWLTVFICNCGQIVGTAWATAGGRELCAYIAAEVAMRQNPTLTLDNAETYAYARPQRSRGSWSWSAQTGASRRTPGTQARQQTSSRRREVRGQNAAIWQLGLRGRGPCAAGDR